MLFRYVASDRRRKEKKGIIEADSIRSARAALKKKGLSIRRIVEDSSDDEAELETKILGSFIIRDAKGAIQINLGDSPPSSKDIIVFSKQMATMIGSGVPLIQALNILRLQQSSRTFRRALWKIQKDVESGESFSSALGKFDKIFEPLYIAMVEAGEASGNLDVILKKLVTYIEKAEKIKSQVKSAMAYPVIVMTVAVAVVTGLLAFVVPIFAQQFEESGRELPGLTQFVINASNFFVDNVFLILGGIALFVVGFRYWINTESGRIIFDRYILEAPVIGDLLRKIAIGRFCSTISSMLGAGVNLLAALDITASTAGNKTIERFVASVRESLESGRSFSQPLSEGDLFPDMVVSMVEVGESSGTLDEMLTKVSEFYEEEVDLAVKTLLSMIEPIMIVFVGSMIAFIVIAMYLPIFDIAGAVG